MILLSVLYVSFLRDVCFFWVLIWANPPQTAASESAVRRLVTPSVIYNFRILLWVMFWWFFWVLYTSLFWEMYVSFECWFERIPSKWQAVNWLYVDWWHHLLYTNTGVAVRWVISFECFIRLFFYTSRFFWEIYTSLLWEIYASFECWFERIPPNGRQ